MISVYTKESEITKENEIFKKFKIDKIQVLNIIRNFFFNKMNKFFC